MSRYRTVSRHYAQRQGDELLDTVRAGIVRVESIGEILAPLTTSAYEEIGSTALDDLIVGSMQCLRREGFSAPRMDEMIGAYVSTAQRLDRAAYAGKLLAAQPELEAEEQRRWREEEVVIKAVDRGVEIERPFGLRSRVVRDENVRMGAIGEHARWANNLNRVGNARLNDTSEGSVYSKAVDDELVVSGAIVDISLANNGTLLLKPARSKDIGMGVREWRVMETASVSWIIDHTTASHEGTKENPQWLPAVTLRIF